MSEALRDTMHGRYRFVRELGRGGMGAVELVFDAVRGQEIARKRILEASSSELLRHKLEFRAIAPLHHPNLAALYELDEDVDGHFFTMEAIKGAHLGAYCARSTTDPLARTERFSGLEALSTVTYIADDRAASHVRRADPARTAPSVGTVVPVSQETSPAPVVARASICDFERLLGALRQILDALAFLHGEGIVHCDIKPSNVLVRADGVVKLLDFGILSKMSANPDARRSAEVAGTAAYMAPERIRGTWPTPAVDLYALGVMIFEIASGRLPFATGTVTDVLRGHLFEHPPLLSSVVTGVPESITRACHALMAKRAESRPTIDSLVRMVFGTPLRAEARRASTTAALVGREAITAALRRRVDFAREGTFATAVLAGPSGAGKTSLFDWLAAHCEREQVIVLRGAARPAERIAFNGIDGAIDDLARLGSRDPELAGFLEAAAAAFPVLHEGPRSGAPIDRASAFTATLNAMARAASSRGLVLAIDDVQWADADSLAFLDALVDAEPPRILLVVAVRDDLGEGAASQWVRARLGSDPIYVGPLSHDATQEILGRAARDSAPPSVDRLVEACAGSPFLAELMGRALGRGEVKAADSIVGLLARIVARTTPLGGVLVNAVVASGGPCEAGELAAIVERPFGDVEDGMAALEADGLVRRLGGHGPAARWDVRHDAVRAAVIQAAGERAMAGAHAAFARLLAPRGDDGVCRRVRHLVASGQEALGAELARRAAVVAEQQLAFGFAAEMYAIALRIPGDDRRPLQRARALALERIGAYRDAAACWHDLREGAGSQEENADALMREARSLLAANEIALGYACLDEALAARGERPPKTKGPSAAMSVVSFLAGPVRAAPPSTRALSPDERGRVEADVHTALLVAHFDVLAGLRLLQRAQRRFFASGAAEGAAWCDYTFALIALMASARRGPVSLAQRYRARAERHLARREPEILEVATFPHLLDAVLALRDGDSDRARTTADAGLAILEARGMRGSHTHLFGLGMRASVERLRQNVFSFEQQLRRMRLAAREGGDVATDSTMRIAEAHIQYLRGDFAGALRTIVALDASWPAEIQLSQRGAIGVEATFLRLALGDVRGARDERERLLRTYSATAILGNMFAGNTASKWALCEVLALKLGEPGASARKARSYIAMAERAPPLLATGAIRASAYLEEHMGQADAALALLARADEEATRAGQPVEAGIARYQRGRRMGGDEGAALVTSARALLVEAGASERLLDEDSPDA